MLLCTVISCMLDICGTICDFVAFGECRRYLHSPLAMSYSPAIPIQSLFLSQACFYPKPMVMRLTMYHSETILVSQNYPLSTPFGG